MSGFIKSIKYVAMALVVMVFAITASKLRQIKMDFSTKQLEINFEQGNEKEKSLEKKL